jgi:hypothetical protein
MDDFSRNADVISLRRGGSTGFLPIFVEHYP